MDVLSLDNYKDIIKLRCKERFFEKQRISLKMLADQLRIQYTYLSKVLNQQKHHLNEDHLMSVCDYLGFNTTETDYILANRQFHVASSKLLKKYWKAKLDTLRSTNKVDPNIERAPDYPNQAQLQVMLNPICLLIHVSLFIKRYYEKPELLGRELGISVEELKRTLRQLHAADFLEYEEASNKITKLHTNRLHFPKNHILTAAHQALFKQLALLKSAQLADKNKESFLATFAGDQDAFDKINAEFNSFIKKAEQISSASKFEHTFYLQFDLLKWI